MTLAENNLDNFFFTALEKKKRLLSFKKIFTEAMREDLGVSGDITSKAIFSKKVQNKTVTAKIVAREPCIISGFSLASKTLPKIFLNFKLTKSFSDGQQCSAGNTIATLQCSMYTLLCVERTLLNILQRLSGIASKTYQLRKILPENIYLLDTRKTTPNLRLLEKYAVLCGGGTNHRFGLNDAFMLKDNHISFAMANGLSLQQTIKKLISTRMSSKRKKQIIIEIDSFEQLKQIVDLPLLSSDVLMLDNMDVKTMKASLKLINGKVQTELSGQINEKRITEINKLYEQGYIINRVSVGGITHSAKAIDFSMEASVA